MWGNIEFNDKFIDIVEQNSMLKDGWVYRIVKCWKYDIYKKTIDQNISQIIENDGWHYCIVAPSLWWLVYYFVISSRFFKTFFYDEIWVIFELLKWKKCKSCEVLSAFLLNNKAFKNLFDKYEISESSLVSRSWVYILNKEKYKKPDWNYLLSYESYINISHPNSISERLLKEYIDKKVIKFEHQLDVQDEEKYLISSHIKAFLYEQRKNWIKSLNDEWLEQISNEWIQKMENN